MDHKNLALSDKITLLSELEHNRHHLLRSAHVAEDDEKKFWYLVKAKQAQDLRRRVQDKWLKTDELDWCLVKSSARLKWLNEEVAHDDLELFSEIERFADDILSNGLGVDLSGCSSCKAESEKAKSDLEDDNIGKKIIEQALENEKIMAGHQHGSRVQ